MLSKVCSVNLTILFLLALPLEIYASETIDNKPVFSSNEGNFQFVFDGRIMLDSGTVDSDLNPNLVTDTHFRRLRFAIKSKFYDNWAAEFDLDFADNEVDIKDMWLAYEGSDNWQLKLGQHKPHFSLAEVTTSRRYNFLEVPTVVEMFGPGRRIGASGTYWNQTFFGGVTLFGDEAGVNGSDAVADDNGASEKFGYSLRAAVRPLWKESGDRKLLLHFAINYLKDRPESDEENEYRYRTHLETRVVDYRFLNTGKIENVDAAHVSGFELLYLHNNWFVQGEYMRSNWEFTNNRPDYQADGYYLQASYFLKGAGQAYKFSDAELDAVMAEETNGELEFALRYSYSDLNDPETAIFGGEADIWTIGLNWYLNRHITFRFNYISAELDEYADGNGDFVGGDHINSLSARMQVLF